MSATAMRRLQTELKQMENDPPPGVSVSLIDDNLFEWKAIINGPEDTPFQGGTFNLRIKFPPDYPATAPKVWFYSRMFHPNVYPDGKICLDILQEPTKWSSTWDVFGILCGIQAMLGDPNPQSPANGEANGLFIRNVKEYERRVRELVANSANSGVNNDQNLNQNPSILDDQYEASVALALQLTYEGQ